MADRRARLQDGEVSFALPPDRRAEEDLGGRPARRATLLPQPTSCLGGQPYPRLPAAVRALDRLPELGDLPPGLVLDGELVAFNARPGARLCRRAHDPFGVF